MKEYTNSSGQLHREDGPAIEYHNGNKHWYINGVRHRTDGPACEDSDGSKVCISMDNYTEPMVLLMKILMETKSGG